jgi:hypothetical protein
MKRTCALESCDVVLGDRQAHYCSRKCKGRASYQRVRTDPEPALPDIAQQLAALLREDREAGMGFDEAWAEDVQAVVRSLKSSRLEFLEALEQSRDVWRAGWNDARLIVGSPTAMAFWPYARGLNGDSLDMAA